MNDAVEIWKPPMPYAPLIRANQVLYARRFERVTGDCQRHWGVLTPCAMLAHLRAAVEVSLGDLPVVDKSTLFGRTLGCALVFRVLPWPKGKIKAPEVFFPQSSDIEQEREKLNAAMLRFFASAEREPDRIGVHPIFGPLSLRYWQRVHGKHFDHHLTQFGA